jgi:hypothetical protein
MKRACLGQSGTATIEPAAVRIPGTFNLPLSLSAWRFSDGTINYL